MAEAFLLGLLAPLVQEAAMKLWARFQQVKATDAEFQELQKFINYIKENSSWRISSSKKANKLVRQRLDEADKKLKEWSSENSDFLARSSAERVRELKKQRQIVESAITNAILIIADDSNRKLQSIDEKVDSIDKNMRELAQAIQAPLKQPSTRPPKSEPSTRPPKSEPSTRPPKSEPSTRPPKSEPSTRPPKSETSTRPPKSEPSGKHTKSDSKVQEQTSSKKRKVDLWQQLWVSIDSDKQANDIKEKLRGLEGVKEVHIDQPSQKVSVLLREGSNISKLTKALIENAQLSKDKRKPTPWADRPR